jgi:antitoxin (DNA-binding transcriptional repressor) of toxin-antitoxin stability system
MVVDHGIFQRMTGKPAMETMAISRFKATCLAVLERVRLTGKPVLITRFGKPVAEVCPPPPPPRPSSWIGGMAGTGRIQGDVIAPASHPRDWEVLRR